MIFTKMRCYFQRMDYPIWITQTSDSMEVLEVDLVMDITVSYLCLSILGGSAE